MTRPKGMSDEDWRARNKRYYDANREKRIEKSTAWNKRKREENPDEMKARAREYTRQYRERIGREEVNRQAREWKKANYDPAKNAEMCRAARNGSSREKILAAQRERHHANRDENNAKRLEHYYAHFEEKRDVWNENRHQARMEAPISHLFKGAEQRARKKGVPFDLTREYLAEIWTGRCVVTGIEFKGGRGNGPKFFSPSIDRIIPERGYVQGNVRFVVWALNAMKYDGNDDDVLLLAEAIIANKKNLLLSKKVA